jgi:hypothetical protein
MTKLDTCWIRENHTSKIDLDSGRDLVHFGPNLIGSQMAQIFVILVADLSFLPTSHTTQAQLQSHSPFPPDATQGNHQNKEVGQSDKDRLYNLVQAGLPQQHRHSASGAFLPSRCEEFLPKLQGLPRCVQP